MASKPKREPNRVIMWSVPRSCSTAFLKCMTYVPNSQVWYEPYLVGNMFGMDGLYTAKYTKWARDVHQLPEVEDLPSGGYQASKYSLSWIKQQLESGNADKDLVFVKEVIDGMIPEHHQVIPTGFKHVFLIRHPYRVYQSWRKLKSSQTEAVKKDEGRGLVGLDFFRRMSDLYEHVKEIHDPHPLVLDADDLQNDPAGVLRMYCQAVGVKYSESLLDWPPGRECMEDKWMIAKEMKYLHDQEDYHHETFTHTGFNKPSPLPGEDELTQRDLEVAKENMKYYKQLYDLRLR